MEVGGGGGGGPQKGEVTCFWSLHLSCKRDQIKMRDYMDRRVTPPKRVPSPTWSPTPPCKQALSPVISRKLLVAAIMKTGKAMPVMSKYYPS